MIKRNKYLLMFIAYVMFTLFLVHYAVAQTFIKGPALIEGVTSTATAAGTTTLTKDSQTNQRFTGVTTQTVVLPDATTLPVGRYFQIENRSTGLVTVQTSGGGALTTVLPNMQKQVLVLTIGTAAGTWDVTNLKIDLGSLSNIVPLSPLLPVKTAADGTLTTGLIDLVTDITGILGVANGGTGLNGSAAPNGSLLIGNGTGYSLATLTGTANRVTVTNGAGTITLSGPQDIATASSPTFTGLTLSSLGLGVVHSSSGGVLSSSPVVLTSEVSGILPLANGGSNKALTASAGSVLYSDADSFEMSAVGSAGEVLTSNGTAAPSWSSISTLLDTTYFKQNGNSFSAAARLGTNDSNVLEFETNNTLVGTFSTTGQFAVGTGSPNASAKVDIQGTDGALLYPRLSTTNRNALTPTAGMQIYNTTTGQFECYVVSWLACAAQYRTVGSQLTLATSFTLTTNVTGPDETIRVQASGGTADSTNTPFGTATPREGYRITLVGNSSVNTVRIFANDGAKGVMPYSVTLGKFQAVTYEYNSSLDRYFIVSFSN